MTKHIELMHLGCPEYPESCPACLDEIRREAERPFWEAEMKRLFGFTPQRGRMLAEYGITPIDRADLEKMQKPATGEETTHA